MLQHSCWFCFVFTLKHVMLVMAAKGKRLKADDLTVEIRVTCNSERYEGVITGLDLLV